MADYTLEELLAGIPKKKPRTNAEYRAIRHANTAKLPVLIYYLEGTPWAIEQLVVKSHWVWSYSHGTRGVCMNEKPYTFRGVTLKKYEVANFNRLYPKRQIRWCDASRPIHVTSAQLSTTERRLIAKALAGEQIERLYERIGSSTFDYEGQTYRVKRVFTPKGERCLISKTRDR